MRTRTRDMSYFIIVEYSDTSQLWIVYNKFGLHSNFIYVPLYYIKIVLHCTYILLKYMKQFYYIFM